MRVGWVLVLCSTILGGCLRNHEAGFPLTDLTGITLVSVRSPSGVSAYSIHDPARISQITTKLSTQNAGWHDSWHTQPAGDVTALFYRDTSLVAVLWVGPGFLAARGHGPRVLRDIDTTDEQQIRKLLAPMAS